MMLRIPHTDGGKAAGIWSLKTLKSSRVKHDARHHTSFIGFRLPSNPLNSNSCESSE